MEVLGITATENVIKVGDTVSDVKEGKHAGVISVGVIEGSSEMALSEEEYSQLSNEEREAQIKKVRETFLKAGADYVIQNMGELPALISKIRRVRKTM